MNQEFPTTQRKNKWEPKVAVLPRIKDKERPWDWIHQQLPKKLKQETKRSSSRQAKLRNSRFPISSSREQEANQKIKWIKMQLQIKTRIVRRDRLRHKIWLHKKVFFPFQIQLAIHLKRRKTWPFQRTSRIWKNCKLRLIWLRLEMRQDHINRF